MRWRAVEVGGCLICNRWITLKKNGRLRRHGATGDFVACHLPDRVPKHVRPRDQQPALRENGGRLR